MMGGVECGRRNGFESTRLSIPDHGRLFLERYNKARGRIVAIDGASCEDIASRESRLDRRFFQLCPVFLRPRPHVA